MMQPLRFKWEQALRRDDAVGGGLLLVLTILATFGNLDGSNIRVGQATLAKAVSLSERQVHRHLATAVSLGYLVVERSGHHVGDGTAVPSSYHLDLPSTGHACPVETPGESISTGHSEHLNRTFEASQPDTHVRLPELHHLKAPPPAFGGPPATDAGARGPDPDILVGDVVDDPPPDHLAKEPPTMTDPPTDQTPALIEAEPKPPPAARRRRIPDDWAPSPEHAKMAASLGLDISWEAAEFRDYWLGCGRPMLDWGATFRNRLRHRAESRGSMRQRPEPASDRRVRQGADRDQRLAAEEAAAVAALFAPPRPLTGPQP